MNPRSHSLNQAVCVMMAAMDATPTTSVQMKATTCSERRISDMSIRDDIRPARSEGLSDGEMEAQRPLLRGTVDQEAINRVHLEPDVDADGANGRQVAQAGADGDPQVTHVVLERPRPYVAGIDEPDRAQLAPERQAHLGRQLQRREPGHREPE